MRNLLNQLSRRRKEGSKDLGLRSQLLSPNTAKKQRTVECQLSFAHAVKVIKMAFMKEVFPSDKLSNDDFDHMQIEILRRTDMIPLGNA